MRLISESEAESIAEGHCRSSLNGDKHCGHFREGDSECHYCDSPLWLDENGVCTHPVELQKTCCAVTREGECIYENRKESQDG